MQSGSPFPPWEARAALLTTENAINRVNYDYENLVISENNIRSSLNRFHILCSRASAVFTQEWSEYTSRAKVLKFNPLMNGRFFKHACIAQVFSEPAHIRCRWSRIQYSVKWICFWTKQKTFKHFSHYCLHPANKKSVAAILTFLRKAHHKNNTFFLNDFWNLSA